MPPKIETFEGSLLLMGSWKVATYQALLIELTKLKDYSNSNVIIDGNGISSIDSAGAQVLAKLIIKLEKTSQVELKGFTDKHLTLVTAVSKAMDQISIENHPKEFGIIEKIGQQIFFKIKNAVLFMTFIGKVTMSFVTLAKYPSRFSFKQLFAVIDDTGVNAIPIVALMSFLIGVVLAYQMGIQLQTYGANIYIAYYSGMAMLREFSPLITAIIVAGRTSSAFTALIGMMKVNEELDALDTMGVFSYERLIVPRILGLLIAMPLLTFLADIFGVFGCMLMSKSMLDIGFYDYLVRLQQDLKVDHYFVGIAKAPVFALIIATVGCFQGYQVGMGADSVGKNTTKSVVQAIFLIIIVDAIFSVLFSWKKM